MPMLGLFLLGHAADRYENALRQFETDQNAGAISKRSIVKGDFIKRRALQLLRGTCYCHA